MTFAHLKTHRAIKKTRHVDERLSSPNKSISILGYTFQKSLRELKAVG